MRSDKTRNFENLSNSLNETYLFSETELDRLFRTDSFNTSGRKNNELKKNLLENDFLELHGPKMLSRRKIQRNSSLIQEIFSDCDFRLLSLGDLI